MVEQKKKKVKRKSIRQNRWAVVIAAVLAFGMLLSAGVMGLGLLGGGGASPPGEEFDLESYLEQYRNNAEQLEAYIEEYGPTVPVLENLAEIYYALIMLGQMLVEDSGEASDDPVAYEQKLVEVYRDLLELEPGEPRHHLGLLETYRELGEDEAVIMEQAGRLIELLREEPAPGFSLALFRFLQSLDRDELVREEAAELRLYLEEQLAGDAADNTTRYYYAVTLGEYLDEPEAAVEQLELILDSEPEDSELYPHAEHYLSEFTGDEENASGGESDQ